MSFLAVVAAVVRRVAQFVGLDGDEERIAIALEQSSFESMSANTDKYEDTMMRARSERACGLPTGGESSKVRAGGPGRHGVQLSGSLLDDLDSTWRDSVGSHLGLANYEALLEDLVADVHNDAR